VEDQVGHEVKAVGRWGVDSGWSGGW